ncbi:MAG TPA: hypothetical protein VMZ02_04195 [Candidatus Limnocylindrales bacterium]|nr:hypothetical protein [Candidatus Limnocylindrales bacterium]
MADEKARAFEETKWWIDRRAIKERDKAAAPVKGIIEKWAFELLENYNQDEAAKNLVDINLKIFRELNVEPGQWGYYSLDIGKYPPEKLEKIKAALPLPPSARGIVIDAGFSVRVMITGEPVGERYVDINFVDTPSLDYWVKAQLIEERVFSNIGEALKRIRADLPSYVIPSEDSR